MSEISPVAGAAAALIAACGLELTFRLTRADDSHDEPITTALALTPAS